MIRGSCLCGGVRFEIHGKFGRSNVALGVLDDDPGIRPPHHIFVGSKAQWVEITDGLPQHDERPPPG